MSDGILTNELTFRVRSEENLLGLEVVVGLLGFVHASVFLLQPFVVFILPNKRKKEKK